MNKIEKLFVESVNGASIISIDTVTIPKLTGGKANLDAGTITKETIGSNVMVFQNKTTNAYQNMVNKRLEAEGKAKDFEVGPRQWGIRIKNTPFVEHKGEMYLEVIFLRNGDTQYKKNGSPILKSLINGLAVAQEEGEQGGLDNKVIIRTFKLANIKAVTVDGVKHQF